MNKLTEQLIRHEALRLMPYEDSVGKLTIGVGRNLDDNGITEAEAMGMLDHDIANATMEAMTLNYFTRLNESRQGVVVNMIFNMGFPTFSTFKRMGRALEMDDYELAADEMKDSKWYIQVGDRGRELEAQMRNGEWAS